MRRGLSSEPVKIRTFFEVLSLLPDCDHARNFSEDFITCAGERIVSVACGLMRKG
jgi:hypothetical protein